MQVKYDVLGIGNAIMDVIAPVSDDVLVREEITKASMTLIDQERALHLHGAFKTHGDKLVEDAGGSGANTIAGIAALGVKAAYMGKVANDDLGKRFRESLNAGGATACPLPYATGAATARCLIAVTPDGERSMSTFLGANVEFGPGDIDADIIRASAVTYLEGYLFDTNDQKAAFVKAAEIAKAAGRQVSLTLSDAFCVDRHRASFKQLVDNHVDILFANEAEILSLFETDDLTDALSRVTSTDTTALITRSEKGSLVKHGGDVYEIAPIPVDNIVDTTGAGDQYAAGVLAGRALGMSWQDAGQLGSLCAAEVITHYGARPETNVQDLVKAGTKQL
ncbi:MAG: adenosine kinase [Robiginitomaculum sp.]|nr:adenosine kinase [Robiginitomaculum sp.]